MAYKVITTPYSEQDLDAILRYMVEELHAPMAAADFADAVDACYVRLSEMPALYELCRNPRLASQGFRRAVIKHYVMIYEIDEQEKAVLIHRFFYGSQEYEKYL